MALWQVGFFILPKLNLELINLLKSTDEESFDNSFYWDEKKVSPLFFRKIETFLPQTESWSEELNIYGNENSNRIEVYFSNDIVESVSFRIDFTSNYKEILKQIIEFCITNDFIILNEMLNVVDLNFESINKDILNETRVKKYTSFL